MAELPDRDKREAALAAVLAKVTARHRVQLIELLGTPPDPRNVPLEFWQIVENETGVALVMGLAAAYRDSALLHQMNPTQADEAAVRFATSHAENVARDHVRRSKRTIDQYFKKVDGFVAEKNATQAAAAQAAGEVHEPITRADVFGQKQKIEVAVKVFGPSRIVNVAQNAVVRAQNVGAKTAAQHSNKRLIAYWRHSELRPKGHSGADIDPCEVCTPLEGKPWTEWAGLEPGEAHENCDCFAEYYMPNQGQGIFLGPSPTAPGLSAWADKHGIPAATMGPSFGPANALGRLK